MIVKSDVFYPALFGLAAVVLLGYRIVTSLNPQPAKVRKENVA
jgi:hypothetical protein